MVIGPDGRMNEEAGELAGLTQEEAGERVARLVRGARPAREARAVPALGRALRALRDPDRAADLAAVVVRDGRAEAAGARGAARAAASATTRSRSTASRSTRSRTRPTGTSRASSGGGTSCRSGTCPDGHITVARPSRTRAPSAARRELDARRPTCSTRGSRRRSGRSRRSAGRTTRPSCARFYPGDLNTTAREIIRLWENRMIFSGLELMGEVPFRDVIIHSTVLAPDGRRMSKSLGTGHRPARGDRRARRRRDALRADEDVLARRTCASRTGAIEEGRKLANKLWNVARLILANVGGRRAATRGRATLEERWILARLDARAARARGALGRVRLRRRRRRRSTTSPSTTSATGTRRRSSRGSTTATRTRARRRSRRSSGCSQLLHPGDAARDRGDLVEPAGARDAPDRRAVAGAPTTLRRRRRRARARAGGGRRSSAAAACRSSSTATSGGSSRRSSSPER